MKVREIKKEDIKVGVKIIHKADYNKGDFNTKTIRRIYRDRVFYESNEWDFINRVKERYLLVEEEPTGMQLFKESIASKLEQEVAHIDESDLAIDYMKAICLVPTNDLPSSGLEDDYVLFKDEVYLVKDSDDPLKYIVQLNGGRIITANKNRFEIVGCEPISLSKQIGGTHYNKNDPIQFARDNYPAEQLEGFFRINVDKYVARYDKKNGLEDLKKARHYLDLLIELKEQQNAE